MKDWLARLAWRFATWTGCKQAWEDGYCRGAAVMRETRQRDFEQMLRAASESAWRNGYAQATADVRARATQTNVH